MNHGSRLLILVGLSVLVTVSGCGQMVAQVDDNSFQRITQTEIRQVATGFPVWLQKSVKIDEFGWDGLNSKVLVGYLYCENVIGTGPKCVPVKVEDIPLSMMIPEVNVESIPLTPSGRNSSVGQNNFNNNSGVSETVVTSQPVSPVDSANPTNLKEIFNMSVRWDETTLKSILSLYLQQNISILTKKNNWFNGILTDIHTSATDANPRLVLIDEQGKRFGVKLALISKIFQ